jgi:hypothetical protein
MLFTLTSVTAFSQKVYLRASEFNIGYRPDTNHSVTWGIKKEVNILIELEENKATVYSMEKQVYRLISESQEREKIKKFYCLNDKGIPCYVLFFSIPEEPEFLYFGIEFFDYVWYYKTKPE